MSRRREVPPETFWQAKRRQGRALGTFWFWYVWFSGLVANILAIGFTSTIVESIVYARSALGAEIGKSAVEEFWDGVNIPPRSKALPVESRVTEQKATSHLIRICFAKNVPLLPLQAVLFETGGVHFVECTERPEVKIEALYEPSGSLRGEYARMTLIVSGAVSRYIPPPNAIGASRKDEPFLQRQLADLLVRERAYYVGEFRAAFHPLLE